MQRAERNESQPTEAPLVSVIIPCYNQAHFLSEAVESVLNQSYTHFEIIVVDDGSTDNTSEVAARYKEARCIRQENKGLPGARNTGLRESRGRYLVFLDSDDRLLPEALSTGLKYLEENPECAFVSGHYRLINAEGVPQETNAQPHVKTEHYAALLENNYITVPASVMYRRTVFDAVGEFDTSLKSSEDYDLYLRISRAHPVYCHGVMVAEYRAHGSNMSSNSERMLKMTLAVHGAQWPFVKGNKPLEQSYRRGRRYWKYRYGEGMVEKVRMQLRTPGQRREALRGMRTILRYYPRGFFKHAGRKLYCTIFRIKD
ncbi:MAG TPA: glycosyltransferase [Pyrinomonadaceae bacterium]|nr:glycosyltransferase [Pyrinomonadaceae bacterium]